MTHLSHMSSLWIICSKIHLWLSSGVSSLFATGNGMVLLCLLEGLESQWEETGQSRVPPDLDGEAELGLIIKREL